MLFCTPNPILDCMSRDQKSLRMGDVSAGFGAGALTHRDLRGVGGGGVGGLNAHNKDLIRPI